MPYDWLKKHNVTFKDVNVRYMGTTPEAVEAFKAGALDWICTIEPYGTALLNDVKGASCCPTASTSTARATPTACWRRAPT